MKEGDQENVDRDLHHLTEDASKKFLLDDPHDMTYGRRVALWLAQRFAGWYAPEPSPEEDAPSLEKAWAFFDHVTLQRYVVHNDDETRQREVERPGLQRQKSALLWRGERKLSIAEPGEAQQRTKLYPIFSTPLSQLGDFGLGFGIYFATIRDFATLAFICGVLSIPNLVYFASEDYSRDQQEIPFRLKGSAVCTDRSWVPCVNCTQTQFDSSQRGAYSVNRFAEAWAVQSTNHGFYLNVTDYLTWDPTSNATTNIQLERTDLRVVQLDNLLNSSIPSQYNIQLSADGGYILNGTNVTERQNGITPLWCGYRGPLDCYLDFYPSIYQKHDEDFLLDLNDNPSKKEQYVGDTDFIQVGFALKNNCEGATRDQGFINWGTLLIMILGSFLIRIRNDRIETRFDEDEQTAQDYSIVIKNPPKDARDAEEWKTFFETALQVQTGVAAPDHAVRVCTIDVDNEHIINYLVERRETLRKIEMALPPGTPLDHNSLQEQVDMANAPESSSGCMSSSPIPDLVQKLKDVESQIKTYFDNTQEQPSTTKIYVTFESEAAQRIVLSHMSVGTYQARHNDTTAVQQHFLFRGKHVLKVREAHEPSTIRWQDLNVTRENMMYRKIATTAATIVAMAISYFIIRSMYKQNLNWGASIVTTIFTSLFPIVATALMNVERHYSETSRQAWLFAKVSLFNIFVTTILLSLITPFEATLDKKENSLPGLLPAVDSLFFSQLSLTPILQLLDIGGNIQRHILAPRAKTQDEMNLRMQGTPVHLAVRYGNMMKFLYMTLWYCSIYPGGFFMGSAALIITYFVDRFSLFRSWARSPHVGAEISYFARQYFTPIAICLMSVASAYYWSGFPYDNICHVQNETLPDHYIGNFDIDLEGDEFDVFDRFDSLSFSLPLYTVGAVSANFTVGDATEVYKHCNQDLRSYSTLSFPALPQWQPKGSEWMTEEQEEVVSAHGWSSLIVLIVIVLSLLTTIVQHMLKFYGGAYHPRGEDQKINFSAVSTIASYIPQVSSDLIAYPLVLCNVDDLDTHLFSWQDHDKPHSHYDVTKDVQEVLGTTDYANVFAKVKHWHDHGGERTVEEQAVGKSKTEETDDYALFPPKVTNEIDVDLYAPNARNLCLDLDDRPETVPN